MFFFNDDKSKVNAESYITQAINNLSDTLRELINQKSNIGHTHSAADIVSGVLDIARIPGLAASKITEGVLDVARIPGLAASKITSGAIAVARGGTGATTADAARTNLGATKKRNITANYSGAVTDSPDFVIKSFSDVALATRTGTTNVTITLSGYTPIAVMNFYQEYATAGVIGSSTIRLGAKITSTTKAQVKTMVYDGQSWPSGGYKCKFDVLYVRTAIINQ